MFEDSLIESGGKLKSKRGMTTTISFLIQVLLIGILVLIPLLFTEALPKQQLMTFLVAPPPPPPPPPPPTPAPASRGPGQDNKKDRERDSERATPHPDQDPREGADHQGRRGSAVDGNRWRGRRRSRRRAWWADGRRNRWHHQFHTRCRSQGGHPPARARVSGCLPGPADQKDSAFLSAAGSTGSYSRPGPATGGNQQRWHDSEPALNQWPSHAGAVRHRSGEAVAL